MIDSFEDLCYLQIPPDESKLILRWRDTAKYSPILRNATKDDGVSTESLSKSTFQGIVEPVLKSPVFFGAATVHSIRRYLGKKVNGKLNCCMVFASTDKHREIHRSWEIPTYHADWCSHVWSGLCGKSLFRRWKIRFLQRTCSAFQSLSVIQNVAGEKSPDQSASREEGRSSTGFISFGAWGNSARSPACKSRRSSNLHLLL